VPITFEVAPDVCDAVITDEEWLWQMLLNLLTNACKYTDKGGIHVRVTSAEGGSKIAQASVSITHVHTSTPGKSLLLEVVDTGSGSFVSVSFGDCRF
jgi:signal transduction histidine kinase